MKGARAFTQAELLRISEFFDHEGKEGSIRDKTIFFLCVYTGRRISEILTLLVRDVMEERSGTIKADVYFRRKNMKGKKEGFLCLINEPCRELLDNYVKTHNCMENVGINKDAYLFPSKNNLGVHISRYTGAFIFKKIRYELRLDGPISTHSGRKTFADLIFQGTGRDLVSLQQALGHATITSTANYVRSQDKKVIELMRSMNFTSVKKEDEGVKDEHEEKN